jgi:hypothetical protein
VVYVDNDPMVLAHSRALKTGGNTAVIEADLRDPAAVLNHPRLPQATSRTGPRSSTSRRSVPSAVRRRWPSRTACSTPTATASWHTCATSRKAAGKADAYAAKDLLGSPTSAQRSRLQALVRASGLDAGTIPGHLRDQLTNAACMAEVTLARAIRTPQEPG